MGNYRLFNIARNILDRARKIFEVVINESQNAMLLSSAHLKLITMTPNNDIFYKVILDLCHQYEISLELRKLGDE